LVLTLVIETNPTAEDFDIFLYTLLQTLEGHVLQFRVRCSLQLHNTPQGIIQTVRIWFKSGHVGMPSIEEQRETPASNNGDKHNRLADHHENWINHKHLSVALAFEVNVQAVESDTASKHLTIVAAASYWKCRPWLQFCSSGLWHSLLPHEPSLISAMVER